MYAWLVLDVCAALVIFLAVRYCAVRGFAQSAAIFFGFLAAVTAAALLSAPLARLAYDYIVRDAARLFIVNRLENTLASGNLDAVVDAIPLLPEFMTQVAYSLAENTDINIATLVDRLLDAALKEPLISIMGSVIFFILFALLLFIVRRFSRLLGGLREIPLIGPVNTVLGGIVGVIAASVMLYAAGIALKLMISITGGEYAWLNHQTLDSTFILRVFL